MNDVFFNSDVLETESNIMKNVGIPSIVLMENAGIKSAEIIYKYFKKSECKRIILITGKGNNAGDGFVIGRQLFNLFEKDNVSIPIHFFPLFELEELKGDAKINSEIFINISENKIASIVEGEEDFKNLLSRDKCLIIDAVFGIGFKGKLGDEVENVFSIVNESANKFVISIDIPSGLEKYYENNNCIKADLTISMGVRKFATLFYSGREVAGKIKVVDIGIPDNIFNSYNKKQIYYIDERNEFLKFQKRNKNSHKYNNGKLFILAGSAQYSGASFLAAQSALRAGCGSVKLGLPKGIQKIIDSKSSEVITISLESETHLTNETINLINENVLWADCVLIGPGIGRNSDTLSMVRNLVKNNDKNFVIDADGIFAFKGYFDYLNRDNITITPHFGEFSNLIGITNDELIKDFYNITIDFNKKYKATLVLKNSPTVIIKDGKFFINSIGNENLATIGSGDVLSGIISSLYAQTGKELQSAITGVYLHSYCGDLLFNKFGDSGTIASDLINIIPIAKKEIEVLLD